MPKFIEFVVHDQSKVMINPQHVIALSERSMGKDGEVKLTRLICLGQGVFDVVGSVEDIATRLENET